MIDTLGWIAIIAFVILIIYSNTFWFRNKEKVASKYAEELRNYAEKWKKNKFASRKTIEEANLRVKNFVETHNNYLHLKEQYRHDEKGKHIRKDWENYLRATKNILDYEEILSNNAPDNVLADRGNEAYQAKITTDEIEKRFKKLLAS